MGGRRQQLGLGRFSVLRRGNRKAGSYRNINEGLPVESRRVEYLEEQEQAEGAGAGAGARRVQLQAGEMGGRWVGRLDGGWLAGSRSTVVVLASCGWFGRGGVRSEVWFGRLQLSDAVNTISLQGWWSPKQSSWAGRLAGWLAKERLGPDFSVETRTWRAGRRG